MNGGYDDDIEILYHNSPETLLCQMCGKKLDEQTLEQRQAHYDYHFSDDPEPPVKNPPVFSSSSRSSKTIQPISQQSGSFKKESKEDIFWYPSQTAPPPSNFTPGLIPLLKRALIKSHAKGNTTRAVLCYDRAVHVSREVFDLTWGCGYRNFLMACTALMDQPFQPLYFALLDAPIPPGVRNLQKWIEAAWKEGFDEDGAAELGHKLAGTPKWIGTAELYVAFTSRGIPAKLVDFDFRSGKSKQGVETLTEWVVDHFSSSSPSPAHPHAQTVTDALRGASPVTVQQRALPLVLQHAGHSRTIIGYEVDRKGVVSLLVFDPSRPPHRKWKKAALGGTSSASVMMESSSSSRAFKRLLHPLSSSNSHSAISEQGKRRASKSRHRGGSTPKRIRGEQNDRGENGDVVVIDDSSDEDVVEVVETKDGDGVVEDDLDPMEIVKFFKLDPKKLGRKDQYQILYFPLGEPLNEHERARRRRVTSTKIC